MIVNSSMTSHPFTLTTIQIEMCHLVLDLALLGKACLPLKQIWVQIHQMNHVVAVFDPVVLILVSYP